MGYNLTIGELKVRYDQDNDCPEISLTAKGFCHDEAPAFGEISDYTSSRYPSYSAWSDFSMSVGLASLFYGKDNNGRGELIRDDALLVNHPGCVPLTEQHRKEVNEALANFKKVYPNAIATYGRPAPEGKSAAFWDDKENPVENGWLCRLVWLHYWVNWALDNCSQPVFENG
jgi:hypothetical protein